MRQASFMDSVKKHTKENLPSLFVFAALLGFLRAANKLTNALHITEPALHLNLDFGLANVPTLFLAAPLVELLQSHAPLENTRAKLKGAVIQNIPLLLEVSAVTALSYVASRLLTPELKTEDAAEQGGIIFLTVAALHLLALRPFSFAITRHAFPEMVRFFEPSAPGLNGSTHTSLQSGNEETYVGLSTDPDASGQRKSLGQELKQAYGESANLALQATFAIGLIVLSNQFVVPHFHINESDANLKTIAGLGCAIPVFLLCLRGFFQAAGERIFSPCVNKPALR